MQSGLRQEKEKLRLLRVTNTLRPPGNSPGVGLLSLWVSNSHCCGLPPLISRNRLQVTSPFKSLGCYVRLVWALRRAHVFRICHR